MNSHRLYRSSDDRMIAGVAAGLADYLDVDPTVVRVIWAISAFVTGGVTFLAYIVMAIVVPIEPYGWDARNQWPQAGPPSGYPATYAPPGGTTPGAMPGGPGGAAFASGPAGPGPGNTGGSGDMTGTGGPASTGPAGPDVTDPWANPNWTSTNPLREESPASATPTPGEEAGPAATVEMPADATSAGSGEPGAADASGAAAGAAAAAGTAAAAGAPAGQYGTPGAGTTDTTQSWTPGGTPPPSGWGNQPGTSGWTAPQPSQSWSDSRWERRQERWQRRQERRAARHERWEREGRYGSGGLVFGLLLILVGAVLFANRAVPNFDLNLAWPTVLVGFGIILVAVAFLRGIGRS